MATYDTAVTGTRAARAGPGLGALTGTFKAVATYARERLNAVLTALEALAPLGQET
jgi:hypothetical protein